MTTPDKTLDFRGWPQGIVNRTREFEVPPGGLRSAENVDILNSGKIQRRDGYELLAAGDWHSIWADEGIGFALGVKDDNLVALDSGGSTTLIRTGVGSAEVSYALLAGRVYWSNGDQCGLVDQDLSYHDWAVETPAPPIATASAAGGFPAGEYQVACTFIDGPGRESGTGPTTVVTLAEGQGIALSGISQPASADVAKVNVYVSEANGDSLYLTRTLPLNNTTASLSLGKRGRQLTTQWLEPLLPGQIVAAGMGRVLVATHNMLRWSEPMRGALRGTTKSYIRFASGIDLVIPVGQGEESSGVYVAAGARTYFLSGSEPEKWSQRIALPTGCIRGTGIRVRAGLFGDDYQGYAAFFVGLDGTRYLGLPNGQIQALSKTYVTDVADTGQSIVRRIAGADQIVTVMRGTGAGNSLGFSDSASAEVNRYSV